MSIKEYYKKALMLLEKHNIQLTEKHTFYVDIQACKSETGEVELNFTIWLNDSADNTICSSYSHNPDSALLEFEARLIDNIVRPNPKSVDFKIDE